MTATQPRAGLRGGKPAAEVERDDLNELLRAIVEALDVADGPERAPLLGHRASRVVAVGHAILTGRTPASLIPEETAFLRTKTAEDAVAEKPVPFVLTTKELVAVIHG